jgi:hypothetical protein
MSASMIDRTGPSGLFGSAPVFRPPNLLGNKYEIRTKARHFPSHLRRRLVRSEPDVNRLPQETVGGPSQIGDLGDELRLDPMHLGKNERRSEARLARRRSAERRCRPRHGAQAPSQVREHFVPHSRANAPGIDEPAAVGIVSEQKRAEMRPRSVGIGLSHCRAASAKHRRSGIVRRLRARSATCPSPWRDARGAFGLR